ncbi:MAG: hypothetical protein RL244_1673, partial [Pseudomonadota bacterium]
PHDLYHGHAALYQLLQAFFRQDPRRYQP